MKKIVSALLSFAIIFSLVSAAPAASAAGSSSRETVEQTIRALGIIVGDENGNMNLGSYVTRAEFAKMMVAASVYKDSVGSGSGFSLFKDVKQGHWAVEYIKVAVSNGWFVGYSDGSFRPDNNITLEEAATSLLRLLGFTSSDIVGAFPYAQLSKFNALGLNQNLSRSQGELITRDDCMTIFYNLMTTSNKSGTIYAKSLGYTINSAGELDFSSLVAANMKGPFVLEKDASLASKIPFSSSNISVYKNGSLSELSAAGPYDVYYYNANMRTVWFYNNRVVGTYTAASPSRVSPTSVTVAGNSYTLGTSSAAYKLSSMGLFSIGDTVTLLLGMNGNVVDVLAPGVADAGSSPSVYFGIVVSTVVSSYTDSSGNLISQNNIKVACTDGTVRQFAGYTSSGSLVSVTTSGGSVRVSDLSRKSISGFVSSDGTKLGSYSFAPNVQILDTHSEAGYKVVYPSRLAGALIRSEDVRYYELDSSGRITHLILDDATGDIDTYAVLTSVKSMNSSSGVASGSYRYLLNGNSATLSTTRYFEVEAAPVQFRYASDGTISTVRNLKRTNITSINSLYASSDSTQYRLADNVQVYIKTDSVYDYVNISAVSDLSKYTLTGYYDGFGYSAGGKIRVIIATKN